MKHFNNAYYFMNGNNLGVHNWGEGYEFDYTCSNTPIPQNVLAHGGEAHAIKADPMFVNMQEGDFHLRDGSPCRDAGRILEGFTQHFEGSAPDIGAYEGDRLVEGPPFRFQEPPGGAYYREKPRIVRHRIADNTLTLFFSLALDAATVQRDAITLFQGDRAIPAFRFSLSQPMLQGFR